MVSSLKELIDTLPQVGEVVWIGVRPARKEPMLAVDALDASPEGGLAGDRYRGRTRTRQVTLLQAEHLTALAGLLKTDPIPPDLVRRNVLVRGINLLALKNREVQIGSVILRVTGLCHPCSRMETILGTGGYNAMRGHGGITAQVLTTGRMCIGDSVRVAPANAAGLATGG